MARAREAVVDGVTVVDEALAAIVAEVAADAADAVVAAEAVFTLLFTKRCSLAS
jgi:hypothetical protein